MAGYFNYSMSNNAVEAYEEGQRPLSKWTKSAILSEVEDFSKRVPLKFNFELFKKIPLSILKDEFLTECGWHHTSLYYNETYFYGLSEYDIAELTNDDIEKLLEKSKALKAEKKNKKKVEKSKKCKCCFLEWSGSRNHPKATKTIEIGEIKGNWFYRENGSKKSIYANGFEVLEEIK